LAAAAVLSGVATRLQGSRLDTILNTAALACVAAVVAALVLMAWQAPRGALERMPWGWALGLAVLMGLWWYAVLVAIMGWNEFRNLLQFEIGERMAGSVHRRAFYYYIPVFLSSTFPWSIGIAGAIGAAWQSAGKSGDTIPIPKQPGIGSCPRILSGFAAERFLRAWVLGIVLFFSIPGGKLASYILPAMPAFALLTARFIVRVADGDPTLPRLGVRITLGLAALAGSALAGAGLCFKWLPREAQEFGAATPFPLQQLAVQFGLAVAGAWFLAWLGRAAAATLVLASSVVVLLLVLSPAVNRQFLEPRSTKQLCSAIADCQRVALLGKAVNSASYYLGRPVLKSRRLKPGEPYDAVIREEMDKPESVALFINKGYYARARGLKKEDVEAMSPAEMARSAPPGARFVGCNQELIVIQNAK
jgi:4-amino-4-deoxy-L-arabinose transferase-like glycosyltransferase